MKAPENGQINTFEYFETATQAIEPYCLKTDELYYLRYYSSRDKLAGQIGCRILNIDCMEFPEMTWVEFGYPKDKTSKLATSDAIFNGSRSSEFSYEILDTVLMGRYLDIDDIHFTQIPDYDQEIDKMAENLQNLYLTSLLR